MYVLLFMWLSSGFLLAVDYFYLMPIEDADLSFNSNINIFSKLFYTIGLGSYTFVVILSLLQVPAMGIFILSAIYICNVLTLMSVHSVSVLWQDMNKEPNTERLSTTNPQVSDLETEVELTQEEKKIVRNAVLTTVTTMFAWGILFGIIL